ncbi:C45 family peptidase [Streptomyces europaeiscabiei]|uniref:hypothetical protein n=1 Tax=Streptomyces europaeiscabiei TaxID=146819 RepID=UPI0038F7FDAA
MVHTNHFLDAELAEQDEINVFAKNSSKRRLRTVLDAGILKAGDTEHHHRLLAAPPVLVPDNGDIRRERTVAAVILSPDVGEMLLWPGDPSTVPEQVHVFP